MAKRTADTFRPGVLQLETRDVPTIMGTPQLVNGVLTVNCNDFSSTVLVSQSAGGVQVQDVSVNKTWSFSLASVKRVDVNGGDGDDTITGRGNVGVRMRFYGNDGNDTFYGAPGRDIIVGGNGDDKLYGRGGNDVLLGEADDDYIDGGIGNDVVSGGEGNDKVNGSAGTDAISGDNGDDLILSIDGGTTDKVDGGPGVDSLWLDKNGTATDGQTGVDGLDRVQAVTAFANGADRTLDGDKIDDPATLGGETYETFAGRPLFSSAGPTIDDVVQQADSMDVPFLDDSWFLSAVGAIVELYPEQIEQSMVDFGDGTYGVLLNDLYFRVDNDLPVPPLAGNFNTAYAALGDESSLWVAILEKVYANYHGANNDYADLDGTGGMAPAGFPGDVFAAFGYSPASFSLTQFVNTTQLSNTIKLVVNSGFPAAIEVIAPVATTALVADQDYTLLGYNADSFGNVTSVILRNPLGIDAGGSTDNDPIDGILTIDIDDLIATDGTLQYGAF